MSHTLVSLHIFLHIADTQVTAQLHEHRGEMALMSVSSVLHGLNECGMALVSVVASLGVAWCCMALVGYELFVCVWNCFIGCLFDS